MNYTAYYDGYLKLERMIRTLDSRIECCREHTDIQSHSIVLRPVSPGMNLSAREEAMIALADLTAQREEAEDLLLRKKMYLENLAYENLSLQNAEIYISHYLKHETARMIAKKYRISHKYIYQLVTGIRRQITDAFMQDAVHPP